MKRLSRCAKLLLILAAFASIRASPPARPNPDAATFWSQRTAEPVSPPAAISVPSRVPSQSPPPSHSQIRTWHVRQLFLYVALTVLGIASAKRRLPQRTSAMVMKRLRSARRGPVERGRERVHELRTVAATFGSGEVRDHLDAICLTCDEIFALFEQRPELQRNSGLIEFTLENVFTIASRYRDLARTSLPAMTPALQRAVTLLASIDGSLRRQFERLLQDDLTQLMSAIELLDTRLEFEAEG